MAVTSRRFDRCAFHAAAVQRGHRTIAEQAAACGLSRQQLHRIFGGVCQPSLPVLDRMADALDVEGIDNIYPRVTAAQRAA